MQPRHDFISCIYFISIIIVITLLHLLSPTSGSSHKQPTDTIQGLLVEEKTRFGSTPPSCYNKCNNCHPCMAVQVPTMPRLTRATTTMDNYLDPSSPSSPSVGNRYSNYKPLGWKCRCGGNLYNP